MTSESSPVFEVAEVLDGWESLRSPDNVYVTFGLPDGSVIEVFAPVVELVELYEHVVEEEPWNTVFGSGHVLEIEPMEDRTILRVDEIDEMKEFRVDHDRLKQEVWTFIRELFREMDEVGPLDSKEAMLRQYDEVRQLYEELVP